MTDKKENFVCFNVNINKSIIVTSSDQTIKCDIVFANLDEVTDAEVSVMFWDALKGSLATGPEADQFAWHSLYGTSDNSVSLVKEGIISNEGVHYWHFKSRIREHHKYNIAEIRKSKEKLPGVSFSYGFETLVEEEQEAIDTYPTLALLGVLSGLCYLLVGIYSLSISYFDSVKGYGTNSGDNSNSSMRMNSNGHTSSSNTVPQEMSEKSGLSYGSL